MTRAPVITAQGLAVRLKARAAVTDISFALDASGLVALGGPNGAGKSTVLRALAGLVPLSAGRISVDGHDCATLQAADRARLIAYMPQDRHVHWNLPARAVVALGRLPHRHPSAPETDADRAAVATALARVDAVDLADRPVLDLSGGERARILMARALAQEARVLLADEPAAGLDPAHQWALFETLTRVAADGVRVVVAMHDLTLMSRFAAHVLLLAGGRLVAAGPAPDALTTERLASVYGVTAVTTDGFIVPTGVTRAAALPRV
jgi:iron complex transport system ATP-binding protein